jgi:hypothetical protein
MTQLNTTERPPPTVGVNLLTVPGGPPSINPLSSNSMDHLNTVASISVPGQSKSNPHIKSDFDGSTGPSGPTDPNLLEPPQ